jgi:hypothetical protein
METRCAAVLLVCIVTITATPLDEQSGKLLEVAGEGKNMLYRGVHLRELFKTMN